MNTVSLFVILMFILILASFFFFFFLIFVQYTCLICNLFDDEDKDQYHCNGCGICRIGGRNNFFHCEVCNMCLPLQLKTNGHRVSKCDSFRIKIYVSFDFPGSNQMMEMVCFFFVSFSFGVVCGEYITFQLSRLLG